MSKRRTHYVAKLDERLLIVKGKTPCGLDHHRSDIDTTPITSRVTCRACQKHLDEYLSSIRRVNGYEHRKAREAQEARQ